MSINKGISALLAALFAVGAIGMAGCESQGPFEEAGEEIDEGVDEVEDEVDDAF